MIKDRAAKTESEQFDYFRRSYERFLRARDSAGAHGHYFCVGGTTVCLTFAGAELVPYVIPALEHLRVPTADPDLTLCVWDSRSTSVQMVPPPWEWEHVTDRGDVWGFNSSRIRFAFHWSDYSVNLMDHSTRTGIYWVPSAAAVPYWARAAPLRTLFHWWVENNGCQLLHAAAVGTDDGAVLLSGKGGTGKSTTALSSLESGLYYLGDDCVVVRLEPEPLAYSLYCTAKLHPGDLAHFPPFANLVHNPEKASGEKPIMLLYPQFERQLVPEMPLKAILVPRLADLNETRSTPAPSWKVLRATAFTTMSELELPHVGRRTHDFICRLCATLPGYNLDLGRSRKTTPAAIASLLNQPADASPAGHADPRDTGDTHTTPLVSVIVDVFNGERHIKDVVENALSQDYPALELIVVDDGSTDRTAEIVSQTPYDIRYFRQAHAGPASARNRGIKAASGEFLAFLNVDSLWPDNMLRGLVDELLHHRELEVVHGNAQLVRKNPENGEYERIGNANEHTDVGAAGAVFRKSAFANVGLFEMMPKSAQDDNWFTRAREANVQIGRIEKVTLLVRRHGVDVTERKHLVELGALRLLKKTLDRKRAREARGEGSE